MGPMTGPPNHMRREVQVRSGPFGMSSRTQVRPSSDVLHLYRYHTLELTNLHGGWGNLLRVHRRSNDRNECLRSTNSAKSRSQGLSNVSAGHPALAN
ncbi:hypothetical protein PAXRUDRAFT_829799 [Paxillus rubicundulus Ve08.2h10]|uniref:Uncharacterized protein n=1 Tax=Paxillus rubicundulus Ve08.2h10 TaxID=930991 RepID=A0A0D0D6V4_9AGAM|nr:hypothetical protein PAXRUDRAFT_829799 [Paxillus rubicundulus Ve08.2h10]